jgi:hypothetical protein
MHISRTPRRAAGTYRVSPNFVRGVGASIALLWCRDLAAAHLPVVVQLRQDVPELDENALRDAVAGELGEPVVLEKDATAPSITVTVAIHHDAGELVVERRDAAGTMARSVPLPADRAEAMRTAVFLVGNLARDEASELVGDLRPASTPDVATPPEEPSPVKVGQTPAESPSLWIGVSAEADLVFLPAAADNACLVNPITGSPANTARYVCADPSTGAAFPPTRQTDMEITTASPDHVAGGLDAANVRLLASVDYALGRNVLVGARVGYVLRSAPSPTFGRGHLEARLTYAIGHDALTREGLWPILLVGVGAGEFDAYVPVMVTLADPGRTSLRENAWMKGGPLFVTAGGGVRALFGRRTALTAALKFTGAFGGNAGFLPGIAPELGVQLGF